MKTQVRGIKEVDGTEVDLKASEAGILHTLSHEAIWTAKGYGWQAMATSAAASLVVRPSTVAMSTLFNNSTDKNYFIERAFAHNLVAAAQCVSVLWLCVHPVGMAAPTNDITVRNNTRGLTAGTEGIFDVGATVVADGWFPWGENSTVVTVTTPGGVLQADVKGRIIVPPTAAVSITVVSSVTTATFTTGFHWYAIPISEMKLG